MGVGKEERSHRPGGRHRADIHGSAQIILLLTREKRAAYLTVKADPPTHRQPIVMARARASTANDPTYRHLKGDWTQLDLSGRYHGSRDRGRNLTSVVEQRRDLRINEERGTEVGTQGTLQTMGGMFTISAIATYTMACARKRLFRGDVHG